MTVKDRSRWWHIRNSLWVLLSLVPLVYWLPFFHIGKKAGNKRYKVMGYVHLAIAICLFVGVMTSIGVECAMLSVLHSFVAFIQCLVERKEYLRQLAQRESRNGLEQKLAQPLPVQPVREAVESVPVHMLNVNTCTEEEFSALPGIGIVEAKKMTALRQTHGEFATVEEFISAIGIKPHVAVRIVDGLCAEPVEDPAVSRKPASRVLDF